MWFKLTARKLGLISPALDLYPNKGLRPPGCGFLSSLCFQTGHLRLISTAKIGHLTLTPAQTSVLKSFTILLIFMLFVVICAD